MADQRADSTSDRSDRTSGGSDQRERYLQQRRTYAPLDGHVFVSLRRKPLSRSDADKAFRTAVLRNVDLREDRFGFEPEITAKVARARCRIYEVGISYDGRTYEEGKKITWRDGIRAFYAIIRYNFFARKPAAVSSNEDSVSESADTVGLGPRLKHS